MYTLPKCGIQATHPCLGCLPAAGVLTTLTANPRARYCAEQTYTPNPTANLNANLCPNLVLTQTHITAAPIWQKHRSVKVSSVASSGIQFDGRSEVTLCLSVFSVEACIHCVPVIPIMCHIHLTCSHKTQDHKGCRCLAG